MKEIRLKEACDKIDITESTVMVGLIRGTKVICCLVPKFSGGPKPKLVCRTGELKRIAGEKRCLDIERSAHIDKRKIQCRVFQMSSFRNAFIGILYIEFFLLSICALLSMSKHLFRPAIALILPVLHHQV